MVTSCVTVVTSSVTVVTSCVTVVTNSVTVVTSSVTVVTEQSVSLVSPICGVAIARTVCFIVISRSRPGWNWSLGSW